MTSPLFDLGGRVALITGSSRGIGKAIATRLAQHGAQVIVSGRKRDACERAAAEIESSRGPGWGGASAIAANVSSQADVQALVEGTLARHGRLDVLVCNAAINLHVGPSSELQDAALRKVIETNMMGLHWLVRAAVPSMVARRDGRIILISSIAASLGSSRSLSYSMTKAAGEQAMRTLAVELGPDGIRCNSIAPGTVRTDMSRGFLERPEQLQAYLARSPVRELSEPDHIAGAAVFLASPAAAHVNGQTIVVDGGYGVG